LGFDEGIDYAATTDCHFRQASCQANLKKASVFGRVSSAGSEELPPDSFRAAMRGRRKKNEIVDDEIA
jgi:hypothetical protein